MKPGRFQSDGPPGPAWRRPFASPPGTIEKYSISWVKKPIIPVFGNEKDISDSTRSDVSARDEFGQTPLMEAAWTGAHRAIKMLIDSGTEINAQDNEGWTGLMYAANYNKLEAMRLLLELGADLDIKTNSGKTALVMAGEHERTREAYDFLRNFVKKRLDRRSRP